MAGSVDSAEIFSNVSFKIGNLLFGRTEEDRAILSKALDELNSINYRYTVVTNPTKAVLLVNQCCSIIPTDDKLLVQKCSQLLWNLVNRQNIVVEGRTLTISVQWCLNGLKINDKAVVLDILLALDSLLRSNTNNIPLLIQHVIKEIRALLNGSGEDNSLEVVLLALQCLEACTIEPNDTKLQSRTDLLTYFDHCGDIFMSYLNKKPDSSDDLIYSKILKICLNGVQNIVTQHPDYLRRELGTILGVVKTFMLYGIKGVDYLPPQKLLPSTLSIPEVPNNATREKKGGKLTKHRKHRTANKKELKSPEDYVFDSKSTGYTPATAVFDYNSDSGTNCTVTGLKLKTMRLEKSAKVAQIQGRIRQTALNLFYNVVKHTEKPMMFAYWSSFIPEGTMLGQHNLVTCILKDPSARSRMAALNVLLLLLTSSKLYLSQAELSERSTSFTPFSVVLGYTLKELHKGLSFALNEMSGACADAGSEMFRRLSSSNALSQDVAWHDHKGCAKHASVQVTALIVLGCVLASEPVVPETKEAMLKLKQESETDLLRQKCQEDGENILNDDFDFAEFSESDEEGIVDEVTVPWLLKKCLTNLGVNFCDTTECPSKSTTATPAVVPAPVKLESLQVLSAMSRNYFEILMASHITHIIRAIDISLSDRYTDLRLHAGRAVDFIGQAMNKYVGSEDAGNVISMEQCLLFWQTLLNGSLIELLQSEQFPILRAVGCDCLGSIGPHIFEQLPRNKQILCVTLLFSCTRDEENSVKGAAVRALAICVLYPSLREDPGFVVDTAESIYQTLKDENLMVRVKASWSLGNLSDALVLNNKSGETLEEIPETLTLKLLQASIVGASDNDKIKMNAVRAIGNLLQLISSELTKKSNFHEVIEQAFNVLVKNSTTGSNMKVRWNACYALGNAMKNPALYQECLNNKNSINGRWQSAVFNSLMELVIGFRNFKVRINAAVALSSPPQRQHYGQFFHSTWVSLLKALENSQNMEDFSEYKHRDHLVEQVCLALGHLTTLLEPDDLLQLEDTIQLYFDTFKIHTHKVLERLVPEKSTTLFSASYALTALSKQTNLTSKQQNVVKSLTEVFVPEL
ncbi:hypothetical protein NQ318_019118 [Aromia moschata]|uniref:HEAT repeat-containing protein 6 n=1 Tax=Aromia moschata TaxID=1265417 RepID=A0AAV8YPN1_9CUCU|nr:hypothetical protein NQ318_019118 [Aromia moschata]